HIGRAAKDRALGEGRVRVDAGAHPWPQPGQLTVVVDRFLRLALQQRWKLVGWSDGRLRDWRGRGGCWRASRPLLARALPPDDGVGVGADVLAVLVVRPDPPGDELVAS